MMKSVKNQNKRRKEQDIAKKQRQSSGGDSPERKHPKTDQGNGDKETEEVATAAAVEETTTCEWITLQILLCRENMRVERAKTLQGNRNIDQLCIEFFVSSRNVCPVPGRRILTHSFTLLL